MYDTGELTLWFVDELKAFAEKHDKHPKLGLKFVESILAEARGQHRSIHTVIIRHRLRLRQKIAA